MLWLLVRRDLTLKYQQSFLGYIWSLVEPLVLALIYWFVFGVLYTTKIGVGGGAYPLFLICGLFPWMWANSSMSESANALTSQSRLITTMKVPRELFPIGRVLGRFAEFVAGLPVLAVFALIYSGHFGLSWLAMPLAVVMQMALLVGIALILAPLTVMMRDVARMVRLVQRMLFYATPILYPLAKVTESGAPEWVKNIYLANPLVGIFQLYHAMFFPEEMPSLSLLGVSAFGCFGVLALGWWTFRRLEPAVLKEL
ncbi:MAG: ABC transporter permease [Micromonosporaceae bacterium]|nr:ABC transporter permease [Micromonosporaceae bacterium]